MIILFNVHSVGNSQELCRRTNLPFLSYSDVAETCFATSEHPRLRRAAATARKVVEVFLCITQLGFCCIYFVFVSQNLEQIFNHWYGEMDYHLYMLIILVPMALLACVRNLFQEASLASLSSRVRSQVVTADFATSTIIRNQVLHYFCTCFFIVSIPVGED